LALSANESGFSEKDYLRAWRTLFFATRFGHMTPMLRRTALAGIAALALAAPALGQDLRPRTQEAAVTPQAPQRVELQGDARAAALAQANRVLNGVTRLQGRFVQASPDGSRVGGNFYMQRPGKLRFEYDAPATLLIVADGSVVAMRDRALRTTDRTPLRSTPLNLILRNQVDLARDARIVRVGRIGDWLMITARDRSGQTDGQIQLNFFGDGAELRSWYVVDATGAETRITLSQLTQPASFNQSLFRLEDMLENNRPGRH
jgi:outer membrane lipoprotein-sorting protein